MTKEAALEIARGRIIEMTTKKAEFMYPFILTSYVAVIRRLLLLGLLSGPLCSTSVAETWKFITGTDSEKSYVDIDSIVKIERDGVLFWTKITREDGSYALLRSAMWPDRTLRMKTSIEYDNLGKYISTDRRETSGDIIPGSVGERTWKFFFQNR
mgnify:CR=1 FL=1